MQFELDDPFFGSIYTAALVSHDITPDLYHADQYVNSILML
jgi:hypothetical protein